MVSVEVLSSVNFCSSGLIQEILFVNPKTSVVVFFDFMALNCPYYEEEGQQKQAFYHLERTTPTTKVIAAALDLRR